MYLLILYLEGNGLGVILFILFFNFFKDESVGYLYISNALLRLYGVPAPIKSSEIVPLKELFGCEGFPGQGGTVSDKSPKNPNLISWYIGSR